MSETLALVLWIEWLMKLLCAYLTPSHPFFPPSSLCLTFLWCAACLLINKSHFFIKKRAFEEKKHTHVNYFIIIIMMMISLDLSSAIKKPSYTTKNSSEFAFFSLQAKICLLSQQRNVVSYATSTPNTTATNMRICSSHDN